MAGKTREAAYKRRRGVWKETLFYRQGESGLAQARLDLLAQWSQDPWAFMSARDLPNEEDRDKFPEGKPLIWTVDEHDEEIPVKAFPAHKTYLEEITRELWRYRIVLADKIRQKYITTLCCLNIGWYNAFREEREVFVSRLKEESAVKMINDKIRTPWKRLPAWVRAALPIDEQPKNIITWTGTGSTVTGVSQNFAVADARGPTGSLILVDEAAFQDFFAEILRAVVPMAARLWAITTANVGNPGATEFKKLSHEGRPGYEVQEGE